MPHPFSVRCSHLAKYGLPSSGTPRTSQQTVHPPQLRPLCCGYWVSVMFIRCEPARSCLQFGSQPMNQPGRRRDCGWIRDTKRRLNPIFHVKTLRGKPRIHNLRLPSLAPMPKPLRIRPLQFVFIIGIRAVLKVAMHAGARGGSDAALPTGLDSGAAGEVGRGSGRQHRAARAGDVRQPWVTHRDPRWWPNPEQFDPERFAPEQRESRPRWAYFPFGGSRVCVGEPFAWAEAVIAVAMIARRWDLAPADHNPILLEPGITLRPAARVAVIPRCRGLN
jgi:hypothetical protein